MNFDHEDRLNDDGTVTIKVIPSNWHVFNISPDTYQLFNLDHEDEQTLEWYRGETGVDIEWDDLEWDYDHDAILRDLAESCMNWMVEKLMEFGLESISEPKLLNTWSPREYNFTTDGFEFEFTCDPEELRSLTESFNVYEWMEEHYGSRPGFISYVPSRMRDPEWVAQYDGEMRVESLFDKHRDGDGYRDLKDEWFDYVYEGLGEVHAQHVSASPSPDVFSLDQYDYYVPRLDERGEVVRYSVQDMWWHAECDEETYPDLLTYHRENARLVSVIAPDAE